MALVGEGEHATGLVVGDELVGDEALHQLREGLVARLVEDEAVRVQLAERERDDLLVE